MSKEYIERKIAVEIIKNFEVCIGKEVKDTVKAVRDIVEFICPAAEVEEVVKCKNCVYLFKSKMICLNPKNQVFKAGIEVSGNHFCGYGAKE